MTYTDSSFDPEPDVLYEIVGEDGTVVHETFDKDEAETVLADWDHTYVLKATPV